MYGRSIKVAKRVMGINRIRRKLAERKRRSEIHIEDYGVGGAHMPPFTPIDRQLDQK